MSILSRDVLQIASGFMGLNLSDEVSAKLISDIEYRLRDIISEAAKFMRHAKRQKLTSEDITDALRVRNAEPPYGWEFSKHSRFVSSSKASQVLYYLEDPKVSLESIISEPLPAVPLDVTYAVHWLAVEGVQPVIAQNPVDSDRLRFAIPQDHKTSSTEEKSSLPSEGFKNVPPLSKEMQFYYEKIVEAILSDKEKLKTLALESVAQDPAVEYLTPYFVHLITDQILKKMDDIKTTKSMLRLIRALLANPHLFIETYLHQIIPNALTCLVARRLSKDPREDHWRLRVYASKLVAYICKKYNPVYSTLQPRITKTLLHAILGPDKGFATIYGAVVGLQAQGSEAVRLLLFPVLPELTQKLKRARAMTNPEDQDEKFNAEKCYDTVASVIASYYESTSSDKAPLNKILQHKTTDELISEIREKYPYYAESVIEKLKLSTQTEE